MSESAEYYSREEFERKWREWVLVGKTDDKAAERETEERVASFRSYPLKVYTPTEL